MRGEGSPRRLNVLPRCARSLARSVALRKEGGGASPRRGNELARSLARLSGRHEASVALVRSLAREGGREGRLSRDAAVVTLREDV